MIGGVERLDPKLRWKISLHKESTNDIVSGTYHVLGFSILWRGVRARKTKGDTVGREK
jgi:hypothetical protein